MCKAFKMKFLITGLVAVAVLSATVGAVSYAMWRGDDSAALASVNVGYWKTEGSAPGPVDNGIGYYTSSGEWKTIPDIGYGIDDYNPLFYIKPSCKDQKIYLALDGVNFTQFVLIDNSGSVKQEGDAYVINTTGTVQWYIVSAQIWQNGGAYEGVVIFDTSREPDFEDEYTYAFELS